MKYNVGDLVVRRWKGNILWEMVGIITHIQEHHWGIEWDSHTIQWTNPEQNIGGQGWRVGEFELIEDVDKKCPTK